MPRQTRSIGTHRTAGDATQSTGPTSSASASGPAFPIFWFSTSENCSRSNLNAMADGQPNRNCGSWTISVERVGTGSSLKDWTKPWRRSGLGECCDDTDTKKLERISTLQRPQAYMGEAAQDSIGRFQICSLTCC